MIETIKDMKHPKSNSYENLGLERTANQILHHMEDKDSEDSLESTRMRVLSNARAIYGSTRLLDVITFGPTSSRKIGAAIVEHNPTGRSFIHCVSAKESSRLAATEHLLVITEDILYRLIDTEGITSSGWLPATPASQHAATYSACGNSVAGSVMGSRKSSVAPQEPMAISYINDYHSPLQHIQQTRAIANNSDQSSFHFPTPPIPQQPQPQPQPVAVQRASSDITAPQPVSANQFPGKARVAWKLGSED